MGANGGTEQKKFGPPRFTYTSGPAADAFCGLLGITVVNTKYRVVMNTENVILYTTQKIRLFCSFLFVRSKQTNLIPRGLLRLRRTRGTLECGTPMP